MKVSKHKHRHVYYWLKFIIKVFTVILSSHSHTVAKTHNRKHAQTCKHTLSHTHRHTVKKWKETRLCRCSLVWTVSCERCVCWEGSGNHTEWRVRLFNHELPNNAARDPTKVKQARARKCLRRNSSTLWHLLNRNTFRLFCVYCFMEWDTAEVWKHSAGGPWEHVCCQVFQEMFAGVKCINRIITAHHTVPKKLNCNTSPECVIYFHETTVYYSFSKTTSNALLLDFDGLFELLYLYISRWLIFGRYL